MPLALAHRGDWSGSPENTLAAFAAAQRAGADMIELDVQLTADGALVVHHDRTLERVWGVDAAVSELRLDEIRAIGEGDARIPELSEVLTACPLPVMLDYKEQEPVVEPVADAPAVRAELLDDLLVPVRHAPPTIPARRRCPASRRGVVSRRGLDA